VAVLDARAWLFWMRVYSGGCTISGGLLAGVEGAVVGAATEGIATGLGGSSGDLLNPVSNTSKFFKITGIGAVNSVAMSAVVYSIHGIVHHQNVSWGRAGIGDDAITGLVGSIDWGDVTSISKFGHLVRGVISKIRVTGSD